LLNSLLGTLSSGVAASTSSFESIASATGTGSSGTITFGSIPSTYASLQIRMISKVDAYNANANINTRLTFNNDTSSTYYFHWLEGNGSAASAGANSNNFINIRSSVMDTADSNTNSMACAIIDIHDYASTTKNKTVRYFSGNDKNISNTAYRVTLGSGLWSTTSAVSTITLVNEVGNFSTNSQFALYGIKGA
jgi:hypothetical protein